MSDTPELINIQPPLSKLPVADVVCAPIEGKTIFTITSDNKFVQGDVSSQLDPAVAEVFRGMVDALNTIGHQALVAFHAVATSHALNIKRSEASATALEITMTTRASDMNAKITNSLARLDTYDNALKDVTAKTNKHQVILGNINNLKNAWQSVVNSITPYY